MSPKLAANLIEIFGKQYVRDACTNITPKLLETAGRRLYQQKNNPLYLISERIRHFFRGGQARDVGYGYDEFNYESPVVTIEDNFDSLLIDENHVSRNKSDSYYVNSDNLFRSHTSAHQMHSLYQGSKAFIIIADCYRRDEIDRSHFPAFHQCEVFKLYNQNEAVGTNNLYDQQSLETIDKQGIYSELANRFAVDKLKSQIEDFTKNFFDDANLKMRWVNAYFPFTHPSFELEIFWRDTWMEVLGCGIVRDEILAKAGIRDHIGFAAGFGLERFGMLKYEIGDIRLFWSKDSGFLHQFENKSPFDAIKFKPFSNCPSCTNDLSFWMPIQTSFKHDPSDFYDICRSVGGDLIEQVNLVDKFIHPINKRTSHCYRITYRAADRVLRKEEVNVVHSKIAKACEDQLKVEVR